MPVESWPVRWAGTTAILSLPEEVDLTVSGVIREQLLALINRGAATLVIDMSVTTFCDSAGVNAVVRAYRRASAVGCTLRLVITRPAVRRVYELTEVDRLVPVSASLEEALAASAVDDRTPSNGQPVRTGTARETAPANPVPERGGWPVSGPVAQGDQGEEQPVR